MEDYKGKLTNICLGETAANTVNFCILEKNGELKHGIQTCKETFVTHISGAFNEYGKFKQLTFGVNIRKEDKEKAEWLIKQYETLILKLKTNSEFFSVPKYENFMIIVPSRRWFRNPTTIHILLTLFRMAASSDVSKTLEENMELFKKKDSKGGHDHYKASLRIFENIKEKGFNFVFRSSKSFRDSWFINTEGDWPGGAYCALVFFRDRLEEYKNCHSVETMKSINTGIRNKYFIGLSSEFIDLFLPKIGEEKFEVKEIKEIKPS